MKKLLALAALAIVIAAATSSQAVTVKEQSAFVGINTGTTNYVDWIWTNDGPIVPSSGAFTFAHGDAATYDSGSSYYYYYQVEAVNNVDIVAFSLNVNPNTVLTAGFISGVNLDDPLTFNHNGVAGDNEAAVIGPVDPTGVTFNSGGLAPNVSFDFDSPTNDLNLNEYSTVLFITCLQPPVMKFSSMQNGDTFVGSLPVPQNPIPEPMTMLLTAISAIGLYIKKRVA